MEPWYKVVAPRKEVRTGRSFNPDEFAIALEQVVAKTAPEDYSEPAQFFARTYFTKALREHAGMVLRRLSGKTANTAPVLTLITQFGGGKTHTLTALYHLVTSGDKAAEYTGIGGLLKEAGLSVIPRAQVAVFVGNAWDPREGRETPWLDIARQLAGDQGIEALGKTAEIAPPGTESITRLFQAAGAPVLLLFDEVLNFLNRHRGMAEQFHAFIQNLTVATTGSTRAAAVISLPRSQVEMTDWDLEWQEKITKVVRRVAKDLIVNNESEISEVVRRRLFEDLGNERIRKNVAKAFADWCFDHRAEVPSEWTAVDSAATEAKAREFLRSRFEACYPFHPATLSVFQRKWQALPQYQQTRGTLALLAQWIAWAYREGYTHVRREPLITLGSAPLEDQGFRSLVLGQLGESRLVAAIDADISGEHSHARALDADTRGLLSGIHRRVGTAILFESSGGQTEKVAHLPELRFALGGPEVDTTSVDNAALALESKSYFMSRVGADGFKIGYQPTLKKVVSDRRASLDEETEIKPALRKLVEEEFRHGASIPVVPFPVSGFDVPDEPRLTLVVLDPTVEWTGSGTLYDQIAAWTRQRGSSPRLYPGSLVWCIKKPGRELREKVEVWLAWKRVVGEMAAGTLGSDFDRADRVEAQSKVSDAEEAAKDEIWGGYRFLVIADHHEPGGLRTIDLGAGHSSSAETLCGRVISALKAEALLSESVGAGYIDRNWPPALRESGAWPLASLRQSFVDGSMTRLLDLDAILRSKIVEFVGRGDFGLASGQKADGGYGQVWFQEAIPSDEITFDNATFLLTKVKARELKAGERAASPNEGIRTTQTGGQASPKSVSHEQTGPLAGASVGAEPAPVTSAPKGILRLAGIIPPELWHRLGTKVIPLLHTGSDLQARVEFTVTVDSNAAGNLTSELQQVLVDLGLNDKMRVEESSEDPDPYD